MSPAQIFQLQITDANGDQRTVPVRETLTLGRQVGNDVQLSDQRVSRQHAAITCDDEACTITDLGSSNGTELDGQKLPPNVPTPLKPGADIQIGPFALTLTAEPAAQADSLQPEEAAPGAPPAPPDERVDTPDVGDQRPEAPDEAPEEPPAPKEPPGAEAPPPAPPVPSAPPGGIPDGMIPPGLALESRELIHHLPGIYHTEFMHRFLGIFEAILKPIEWNVDNFDLFLNPDTAPTGFLPWLTSWFDIAFDPSWSERKRRQLLNEAHLIYARRGTKWALRRVLEIYTGATPLIVDVGDDLEPFTFRVKLPFSAARSEREMIERLIDAHKPAHTGYALEFAP